MPTTYGSLTVEQRMFYETVMLARAVPSLTHLALAQRGYSTTIPEHSGHQISWRRMASLPVVTTPLAEGIVPDPHDITVTQVTAAVQEYGAYLRYTRFAATLSIDNIVAEASEALGEQAGESLDLLTRDVITGGQIVQFASTATSRSTITSAMKLNAAEVWEAITTLKIARARPFEDGYFVGIVHPHTTYDMFADTTMQNLMLHTKERGEDHPMTRGYVGDFLGVRWYESANARVFPGAGSGGINVYATMIIGRSAFGIGGLAGFMPTDVPGPNQELADNNTLKQVRPLRLIQKDFGSAGADDPLDQKASIAWYTTFAAARLVEGFMVRIEHATTNG